MEVRIISPSGRQVKFVVPKWEELKNWERGKAIGTYIAHELDRGEGKVEVEIRKET